MKERISSIPLTDALNKGCGCILCTIEKKLEEEPIAYFLGPSLMEPDSREITNAKGFCSEHMNMLLEGNHRLGFALILETHVKTLYDRMNIKKRTGLLAKGCDTKKMGEEILSQMNSCALCDKLDSQMAAAAENLAYLWDREEDFRKKFENGDSLCPRHMGLTLSVCTKEFNEKRQEEFAKTLVKCQKKTLNELYEDLHNFTLSFDYRNKEKPSEKVSQSVNRAVEHLSK